MTILSDLVNKDGWRKFTFAIWITSLGFVLALLDKMTGDAFGTMAGATMMFLSAAEVGQQYIHKKAANAANTAYQTTNYNTSVDSGPLVPNL